MVCPLGNNQEMLQGPSVSITHKERNSSTLKTTIISRKRKRKKCVAVCKRLLWEWVNHDSKESIKVECPLEDNGKTLQESCVTVTPEEWENSIEKATEIYQKMCGSPHNLIRRMGHQWLKKKQQSGVCTSKRWNFYKDLVQSYKKSGTVSLRKWTISEQRYVVIECDS